MPDALAASTSAIPAGPISPEAIRRATRSRLDRTHVLRGLRGENRW